MFKLVLEKTEEPETKLPTSTGSSKKQESSKKVKGESEVAQSCLTLSNPMDCSLPGSSVHGIFQARVLEWGAIAFSKNMKDSNKSDIYYF